jgi:hypothetical protein
MSRTVSFVDSSGPPVTFYGIAARHRQRCVPLLFGIGDCTPIPFRLLSLTRFPIRPLDS